MLHLTCCMLLLLIPDWLNVGVKLLTNVIQKLSSYVQGRMMDVDNLSFPGRLVFHKKRIAPPYEPESSSSSLAFVRKAYVINLERRPDRWAWFMEHASTTLSLPPESFTRIEAVDGDLLDPITDPRALKIFNLSDWR